MSQEMEPRSPDASESAGLRVDDAPSGEQPWARVRGCDPVHGGPGGRGGLHEARRRPCVTVSFDRVDFKEPIFTGEVVTCKARVNFVGRTSMEIGVRVEAENLFTRDPDTPTPVT